MPYMTQKAIARQLDDEINKAITSDAKKSEVEKTNVELENTPKFKSQKAISRQLDDEIALALANEPVEGASENPEEIPADDMENVPVDQNGQPIPPEMIQGTEYGEMPTDGSVPADTSEIPPEQMPVEGQDAAYSEEMPEGELPPEDPNAIESVESKEVSTTYLNDNYRNEHLFDLAVKLKEICKKYKYSLSELDRDELTEKQFNSLQAEDAIINRLIGNINKFTTDYFTDRLYNENLITYLHLRSALIASVRRIKELLKV